MLVFPSAPQLLDEVHQRAADRESLQQLPGQTQMYQWKSNHVELICSAECT